MRKTIETVLVIQPQEELRSYTCSLLTDMGFRHVLQASSITQAELILDKAKIDRKPVGLIVCDDNVPEGALSIMDVCGTIPCSVISDANNPKNLRIAARLGVTAMLFRPYGKSQLTKVIRKTIGA